MRKWWILAGMTGALSLVFVDQSAVNVALPTMQRALHASDFTLQWFVNAYLLTTAATIIMGGKLADHYGYKRVFLLGVLLFTAASISAGLAPSASWVILSRLVQGLGSAMMIPASGVILVNAFTEAQRGKAIGLYVAIASIFLSIGPYLGGWLTEHISWRWVFWINVPIATASFFCALFAIPKDTPSSPDALDWFGFVLLASSIVSILLSLSGIYMLNGFSWHIFALFITGMILLFSFHKHQQQTPNPLVNMGIFTVRGFSSSVIVIAIIQLMTALIVFLTLYMQNVLQQSPGTSGVLLLPLTIPIAVFAPIGGQLRDHYGPWLPVRIGTALFVLGTFGLSIAVWQRSYVWIFPNLLLLGSAIPLCMSSCISTAIAVTPPGQRGVASGIVNSLRQLSGGLGLAVFGALIHRIELHKVGLYLQTLPTHIAPLSAQQLSGLLARAPNAQQHITTWPTNLQQKIVSVAENAYITGFSSMALCISVLGLVALWASRNMPRHPPGITHNERQY